MISIETLINYPGSVFNGEYQDKYNVILDGHLVRTPDSLTLKMNGVSVKLDKDLFDDIYVGFSQDVKVRISLL